MSKPTPQTDAVGTNGGFYRSKEQGWYVPIDFARKLEAQRDSAWAALEFYAGNFPNDDLGSWQERVCADEGDIARAAIAQKGEKL